MRHLQQLSPDTSYLQFDTLAVMQRCRLLALTLTMTSLPLHAHTRPLFDPRGATIGELRHALDAHRITAQALVRYYEDRIARFDKSGPRINAMIRLNAHALEQAKRLDAEPALFSHSDLRGIPFIVKDNYDTVGMATSGGSAVLKESFSKANAFVVQRLLDQGAILLGKANMSELAASYGRLGYSSAGGLTVNPYDTARSASGSSSGSAAAVAADFAPFALGTDTAGSVRGPASVTGLVGLRPTLGLVSRGGIIPSSLTFDTPGVMTRSVADMALVLDVIAGPDGDDASSQDQPPSPGYARTLAGLRSVGAGHALAGVRLGVIVNFRGGNAEVDALERLSLARLESLGAVLVPVELPEAFIDLWSDVMAMVGEGEFKPQIERYLRGLGPEQPHSLAQLIARSESPELAASPTPINPARLEALRSADKTDLTDSPAYIRALTRTLPGLRDQLGALMSGLDLQAMVFSTLSCPAGPRFDREDPSYVCASADVYRAGYVAAAVGFPEITVPAGATRGNLPVGFSFLGGRFGEPTLLALAKAFEAAPTRDGTARQPTAVLPF